MNNKARELRMQLVHQLKLEPKWRVVFERVPRHVFVPRIIGCWPPDPTDIVVQAGPRRLWDEWEAALDEWTALGSPGWERFGLTVHPDGSQFLWLDSPESGHVWEL